MQRYRQTILKKNPQTDAGFNCLIMKLLSVLFLKKRTMKKRIKLCGCLLVALSLALVTNLKTFNNVIFDNVDAITGSHGYINVWTDIPVITSPDYAYSNSGYDSSDPGDEEKNKIWIGGIPMVPWCAGELTCGPTSYICTNHVQLKENTAVEPNNN